MNFIKVLAARINVRRHPDHPELWLRLGRAYQERAELHRPETRFLDIVCPDPTSEVDEPNVVYLDPAPLFFNKAIFAYQRAISLKPDYAQAWEHLGAAYTQQYRRGYWCGDDRLQEGLTQDKQQRLAIAASAFQQALKIEPDNAVVWNNLGFVYGQLDRFDDEVSAYRHALKIKPDDVETWHRLTTVYYNRSQPDKVAQVCQEAVKNIPLDAHSWYDMGYANEELGRLKDAAEAYNQARQLDQDFPGPWVRLGVVYARLGRVEDAVRVYSDVIEWNAKQRNKFWLAISDLKRTEQGEAVLRHLKSRYPEFMSKQRL